MDAPWKTTKPTMWWGHDAEGKARGFSWCNLCGDDCPVGVVVASDARGSAFFCADCCRRLNQTVADRSPQGKA